MGILILNHKKRLLFTTALCLFSVFLFSSGKIFINLLDMKSKASAERNAWASINQNIESEFSQGEQHEWSDYSKTHPELFLKANTTKFLNVSSAQEDTGQNELQAGPFENMLANIVISAREHTPKVAR